MKTFLQTLFAVVAGVLGSGFILDLAHRGQLGGFGYNIAKRITNGFGDYQEVNT